MFSEKLLTWFDKHQRSLPWRLSSPNPYYTWLSEIMLQQTTVATVIPYFHAFITKWPTLQDLALASLDDVLVAWQGLGYYSRARNLHKAAHLLVKRFPVTPAELVKFPGIGPYTAAAIASIAFNQKAAAVDGNVVRVLSRYFAIPTTNPITEVTNALIPCLPEGRYGDFTQSLMELGALICRPKAPACSLCPLQQDCKAHALQMMEDFPVKSPKTKLPTRYTRAFILRREDGALLLRKRPSKGLLGGMMEVPTTAWEDSPFEPRGERIRHTFTHFHLEVDVCPGNDPSEFQGIWVHPKDLHTYPLPTLMKKILKATLALSEK